MEVTLQICGREMTFSREGLADIIGTLPEKELTYVLEMHFAREIAKHAPIAQTPTEGKWFTVNPQAIKPELFKRKRGEYCNTQEIIRSMIVWALDKMKQNPEKYGRVFETLIPEKSWSTSWSTSSFVEIFELNKWVSALGYHHGTTVHQALEWAQRITNGETWEQLCNESDTVAWSRVVRNSNKNTYMIVGGAKKTVSPATILCSEQCFFESVFDTVPYVVRYKE